MGWLWLASVVAAFAGGVYSKDYLAGHYKSAREALDKFTRGF